MRVFLIVIDGLGIGELPDASLYGDIGANTLKAISKDIKLPNLSKLGLWNIFGCDYHADSYSLGSFARMRELSEGKDTLTGHYELAGVISYNAPTTYPNGFPQDLIDKLERAWGVGIIGNISASGTEIINKLGDEHIKTRKVIVYTSADSVLQIAAHEKVFSRERLYRMCEQAVKIVRGNYDLGRIIARPFVGESGNYTRTEGRKDFVARANSNSLLNFLTNHGVSTYAIGKINDIFDGKGIEIAIPAHNTKEVAEGIFNAMETAENNSFIFANFVDTDMLYGHRRDIEGYRQCLEEIDGYIGSISHNLNAEDLLIVTSDHGCDPSFKGTDHTREYTPLMVYGTRFRAHNNLGTVHGFDSVAFTVTDYFGLYRNEKSFLHRMQNEAAQIVEKKNIVVKAFNKGKNVINKTFKRKSDKLLNSPPETNEESDI